MNDAVAAAPPPEAPAPPAPPTAEETMQLELESGGADGPLGLAFVKADAGAVGLPTVSGVKPDTAVAA